MVDGLKMSFSASTDNGAAASTTYKVDGHYGIGATYVTTAGDSTVTLGFGISETEGTTLNTSPANDEGGVHMGISAVTGDLTVAVGFADGDSIESITASTPAQEVDGEVVAIGAKYVTGDLTFNVGVANGTSKDGGIGTPGTTEDSKDVTSASISYAVASGVTAILGYTDVDSADEGTNDTTDGSAWYIGANMSF